MGTAKWDERHATGSLGPPLPIIERIAREQRPGAALDLACGLGRHALLLAGCGWTVDALDSSEVAIARLREFAGERALSLSAAVQDLESPYFVIPPDKYDLICDCFYLHRPLITRIQIGTRIGGLAALALPMHDDTPGIEPMNPEFLVQPGELRSWFEGWEILEHKEQKEAQGRRLVATLIARRTQCASKHL